MFGYYFDLALRSLRRSPVITGLMVLAIGLGIGASMTMVTVLHVMSGDPLPARSAKLFYPTLDPRPLRDAARDNDNAGGGAGHDSAVDNFTYVDAMALLRAHRAPRQAMMAGGTVLIRARTIVTTDPTTAQSSTPARTSSSCSACPWLMATHGTRATTMTVHVWQSSRPRWRAACLARSRWWAGKFAWAATCSA
jgi:hypothetical protein